jgi:ectoine hydroxylase-related dioxygenase (phytanoyl-CoA dioxygenase family)
LRQNQSVLTRKSGYLRPRKAPVSDASHQLQDDGYTIIPGVLGEEEVAALIVEVERVFDEYPPDVRDDNDTAERQAPFRYEMLNRSGLVQRTIGHPRILETIEPLLGEDCHVIANTTWWQQPGSNDHLGRFWHIDGGPHIPRDPSIPWDSRIPYPVFAIATHIYLWDCPVEAGATGVIPGSHTSGQPPPFERLADETLTWEGKAAIPVVAQAGDVALFVSDIWHRRLPPSDRDPGRMFIQCHYGRRDIAQRIRPTSSVNHLSPETLSRAESEREKTLVGYHQPGFYDG